MKIAELNQFIITAQPQVQFQTIICLFPAIFLTLFLIAIIYTCSPLNLFALEGDRFKPEKGWCYISFSKCSEKLHRGLSLLTCLACNNTNIVGDL